MRATRISYEEQRRRDFAPMRRIVFGMLMLGGLMLFLFHEYHVLE